MVKAVVALLLSLAFVSKPPSITISPSPPTQGGHVSISVDGPLPAHVTVVIKKEDGSEQEIGLTFTGPGPISIEVPDDAVSIVATDDDGVMLGDATTVTPN